MRLIAFFFIVASISCQSEGEVPEYVLPEEKMVEVLTEFEITEAVVRLGYHRNKDSIILNDSMYAAFFRKMDISQAIFDSNYTYYSRHPEQFEKIYDKVLTRLSTRSAELNSNKKKES